MEWKARRISEKVWGKARSREKKPFMAIVIACTRLGEGHLQKHLPPFLFNLKPLLLALCIIAPSRASLLFCRISPLCSQLSNSFWHHLSLPSTSISTNDSLTLGLHPISTPRSRISKKQHGWGASLGT